MPWPGTCHVGAGGAAAGMGGVPSPVAGRPPSLRHPPSRRPGAPAPAPPRSRLPAVQPVDRPARHRPSRHRPARHRPPRHRSRRLREQAEGGGYGARKAAPGGLAYGAAAAVPTGEAADPPTLMFAAGRDGHLHPSPSPSWARPTTSCPRTPSPKLGQPLLQEFSDPGLCDAEDERVVGVHRTRAQGTARAGEHAVGHRGALRQEAVGQTTAAQRSRLRALRGKPRQNGERSATVPRPPPRRRPGRVPPPTPARSTPPRPSHLHRAPARHRPPRPTSFRFRHRALPP